MATIHRLSTDWKGAESPSAPKEFPVVALVSEMNGPFISTNSERRQIQYNAQVRESIRLSKLSKYDPDYLIKSQPFYCI